MQRGYASDQVFFIKLFLLSINQLQHGYAILDESWVSSLIADITSQRRGGRDLCVS